MPFLLGASGLVAALLGSGGGRGMGRDLEVREWHDGNVSASRLTWCETPEVVALVQASGSVDCSKHVELGRLPLGGDWERSVVLDRASNTLTLASGPSSNLCREWYIAASLRHGHSLGHGAMLLGDASDHVNVQGFEGSDMPRHSFCLPAGASLRLDVPLLLPVEQPAPRFSLVCARLRAAFNSSRAFTVTSGTSGKASAGRLAYWLDYCALHGTNIQLWHQPLPGATRSGHRSVEPSPCDVRSVAGLPDSVRGSLPAEATLHCIEDVLSHLSDNSSSCQHGSAAPLVFVSALDLPPRKGQDGNKDVELTHFLRVLRAFTNHAALPRVCPAALLVRSLRSGSVSMATGLVVEEGASPFDAQWPACLDVASIAPAKPADVFLVALSRMYVLAFVLPAQLAEAQTVVDGFRRMCTTGVCHLYVTYFVSTADPEEDSQAEGVEPSMRLAWMQTRHFFESFARSADVVAVLVGMDALRAFPGISPRGVIPSVEYGKNAEYRLPAPLIIASAAALGAASTPTSCVAYSCARDSAWEVRAMAGTAGSLSDLYDEVQRGAGYAQASDAGLRCAVIGYAAKRPARVLLDLGRNFFDFAASGHRAVFHAARPSVPLPDEATALGVAKSVARLQAIAPLRCVATADTRPTLDAALRTLFGSANLTNALELARALQANGISCCSSHGGAETAEGHLWELARSAEGLLAVPRSVALSALLEAAELLGQMLDAPVVAPCTSSSASDPSSNPNLAAARASASAFAALAGLQQAASNMEEMMNAYTLSLLPSLDSFPSVHAARAQWQHQRQHLRLSSSGLPVTHYITMASSHNEALGNLKITADLAGVALTVLGLGSEWRGYSDKLRHYTTHLASSAAISDDDVVVLMDAYDVLLFPAARRIGAVLAETSATPIVFCAENGVYPEGASAGMYRRGAHADAWRSPHAEQRFLNSGCIAGRAGQMRAMLQEADAHGAAFQNDQHFFVRYMLAHPGLVSVDVHRRLFATAFKLSLHMRVEPDLSLRLDAHAGADADADAAPPSPGPSVGLVHFNNMGSSNSYALVLVQIVAVLEAHYKGDGDGAALLEAVRLLAEGNVASAAVLLAMPDVVANSSANSLSAFIRRKYAREPN